MTLQGDHRICFVGDSFIQGTCDPEYRGWVGRVASSARSNGCDLTSSNLGVRRDTSAEILRRWQSECAARLPSTCTPYVVFSFGANDMTSEKGRLRVTAHDSVAHFTAILATAVKDYQTLAVGPLPVGDPEQDERIVALCSRYAEQAQSLNVPYLPLVSQIKANALWRREVSENDGSHPGSAGYELIASCVLDWEAWWFRSEKSMS